MTLPKTKRVCAVLYYEPPKPKQNPYRCPKCHGLGWLLYDPLMPFGALSTNAGPWQCPPCLGAGILWGPQ